VPWPPGRLDRENTTAAVVEVEKRRGMISVDFMF
jgi:hypothetical protein